MGFFDGLFDVLAWFGLAHTIRHLESPGALKKREAAERRELESQTGLRMFRRDEADIDALQMMLDRRVQARSRALTALYHAIDWQPIEGKLSDAYQGRQDQLFNALVPQPVFADTFPAAGFVNGHQMVELIATRTACNGVSSSIVSQDDSGPMFEIERSLDIIRTQYWTPNAAHHDIWLHILLGDNYDYMMHETREGVRLRRQSPFDVSADIVERTTDELAFFDQARPYIVSLSREILLDGITWNELNTGAPLSAPCLHNLGYGHYSDYINTGGI